MNPWLLWAYFWAPWLLPEAPMRPSSNALVIREKAYHNVVHVDFKSKARKRG